ncbi:MAG: hypothetical protein H7256_13695 [Bdellovibrio sp.]|nr:hypothetical protein [Bdellovibrio sp.]
MKKKGRIVLADLDDEVFGLGVACGGKMEIFINPVLQIEEVTLQRTSGFDQVAKALAHHRKVSVKSLREVKDLPVTLGATP